MEDLIYSFLLQSGYPRASIVYDTELLGVGGAVDGGFKVPSFVIVDPDTAEPLAVVEVVDAIDADSLKLAATQAGAYASKLAGKSVQGYVIRVDEHGLTEDQQVQFYRVWPNSTLHQLSSKNFPDLDALRVARKLMRNHIAHTHIAHTKASSSEVDLTAESGMLPHIYGDHDGHSKAKTNQPGAGLYIPAIALLLLIILDIAFLTSTGSALISVSHSLLAFGAALLFSLPAAIRYLRS